MKCCDAKLQSNTLYKEMFYKAYYELDFFVDLERRVERDSIALFRLIPSEGVRKWTAIDYPSALDHMLTEYVLCK